MYPKGYYNYWDVIRTLHEVGFAVRLNVTMVKGGCDKWSEMYHTIERCREYKVEQLTLRDVAKPDYATNEIASWTEEHQLCDPSGTQIATHIMETDGGIPLLRLNHGATVYDYHGQNVCLNNCLTETTNPEEIRQLIFFPDGSLRYSWNYEAARIL